MRKFLLASSLALLAVGSVFAEDKCAEATKKTIYHSTPDRVYAGDKKETSFENIFSFTGCNLADDPSKFAITLGTTDCTVIDVTAVADSTAKVVTCKATIVTPKTTSLAVKILSDGTTVEGTGSVDCRIPKLGRTVPSSVHKQSTYTLRLEVDDIIDDASKETVADSKHRVVIVDGEELKVLKLKDITEYYLLAQLQPEFNLASGVNYEIALQYNFKKDGNVDNFETISSLKNFAVYGDDQATSVVVNDVGPSFIFQSLQNSNQLTLYGKNLNKIKTCKVAGYDCKITGAPINDSLVCVLPVCTHQECIKVHDIMVTTADKPEPISIGEYEIVVSPSFKHVFPANSLPELPEGNAHYMHLHFTNFPRHFPISFKIGDNSYNASDDEISILNNVVNFTLKKCVGCTYPSTHDIEVIDSSTQLPLTKYANGFTYTALDKAPAITGFEPQVYETGDPGSFDLYGFNLLYSKVKTVVVKGIMQDGKDLVMIGDIQSDGASRFTMSQCVDPEEKKCRIGTFDMEFQDDNHNVIAASRQHQKFVSVLNTNPLLRLQLTFTENPSDEVVNSVSAFLTSHYNVESPRIKFHEKHDKIAIYDVRSKFRNAEPSVYTIADVLQKDLANDQSAIRKTIPKLANQSLVHSILRRCGDRSYALECTKDEPSGWNTVFVIFIVILIVAVLISIGTIVYGKYAAKNKARNDMLDEHSSYAQMSDNGI